MPAAYTPKAPAAPGTDDYRCFLLDPHVTAKSVVTGINVLPGNPSVVHHVILFRIPPAQVARAQAQDDGQAGQGWTCFGGTGVEGPGGGLDDAPWLGAWAPGGGESLLAKDLGMPLEPGTRIVMQVHYNLLAGNQPDTSAAKLRVAAGRRDPQDPRHGAAPRARRAARAGRGAPGPCATARRPWPTCSSGSVRASGPWRTCSTCCAGRSRPPRPSPAPAR